MEAPTYYIFTYGCQMNFSDSERISAFLEQNKINPSNDPSIASIVIFNTCGVRASAENRVFSRIHLLRKKNPQGIFILTGCLAVRKDVYNKLLNKIDLFLKINQLLSSKNFTNLLQLQKKNLKLKDKIKILKNPLKTIRNDYFKISPKREKEKSLLIPIMTGCNNFCSYCVVPYARGREFSRSFDEIIQEIKQSITQKTQNILLLGQNVNSYQDRPNKSNHKSKKDFPSLLDFLAKKFNKINFNFLTSHPKDFSSKLITTIKDNANVSKTIHLPLQSGSDKILKLMNRPYSQKQYLSLIQKIKNAIPSISFTTDIIIGFPGENEIDFQETIKVFQIVNFQDAFFNKYSPRPGTQAFSLGDPIPLQEKKRREKILRTLIKKR